MEILGRCKLLVWGALAALFFLWAPFCAQAAASSSLQLHEQKIKAGLIYNFLKYTSWHPGQQKEQMLRVCLIGGDPLEGYLYPLQDRTAQQLPIDIVLLEKMDLSRGCNVAIIHSSLNGMVPKLLPAMNAHGVLTISDISGFAKQGGMVELSKGGDKRIHILINQKAVRAAGLDVQDRLLKLAEVTE